MAVEEEKEARAGLTGRNVREIEGMPPIVDPWATPAPAGAGAPTTDATADSWAQGQAIEPTITDET